VIIEAARPAEVAPLIVQAYDLTKRESEILQLVVRGHSTVEPECNRQDRHPSEVCWSEQLDSLLWIWWVLP